MSDIQRYVEAFATHVKGAAVPLVNGSFHSDYDPFSELPAEFFASIRPNSSQTNAWNGLLLHLFQRLDTCPDNGLHPSYKAGERLVFLLS